MGCDTLVEKSFDEFSPEFMQYARQRRVPISGSVELTFRCNVRCVHCYVSSPRDRKTGLQELTQAEFDSIFGQLADAGTLWLLLTGGEPLARPDFREIYQSARRKGMVVTLFTNATLVTPQLADFLAENPPHQIEITLYGYTQAAYERITGIPGSHARCMRGIELLMERKLPVNLKTMLMKPNQHELDAMQSFADRLGLNFRFDALLNGGIGTEHAPIALRLSPEEVAAYDGKYAHRAAEWKLLYERYQAYQPDPSHLYHCGAGINSFHIDPYGRLSLCMMARAASYDLRQGSFKEGWGDFLKTERFQTPKHTSECQSCKLLPACGQCPGWSQLEHGDSYSKVDYLCQVTHQRMAVLDR